MFYFGHRSRLCVLSASARKVSTEICPEQMAQCGASFPQSKRSIVVVILLRAKETQVSRRSRKAADLNFGERKPFFKKAYLLPPFRLAASQVDRCSG